ncbi:myrosinase 4 [Eutrema salsugineum]|nr:myrosinase 4 [Eutrema salsugineum]
MLSTMDIPKAHFSLAILVILFAVSSCQNVCNPACKAKEPFDCDNPLTFNRTGFPNNFTFGAATSAYQIEGAARRAFNGWDYYTHRYPERVPDRSTGDLACNSYELYKDDVQLLKKLNVQAYRFSIAWSRVLPKGSLIGGIDENGIKYYNNLINELKANGIEPYVTIFHWDVPQTLEDKYEGFLSPLIVEDYKNYAELLFQRFGDRVKFWITFNQPYSFATKGYGDGSYPPGRCTGCEFGGNSGTEPYVVAHHQLLAHAKTVSIYREKYQKLQGGKIGTTLIGRWFVPLDKLSIRDNAAAKRAFDFFVGWFLDPLVYGDYPLIMKVLVGERLPRFTLQESEMVRGSLDFLGLNYYVSQYATDAPPPLPSQPNVSTDPRVTLSFYRNGIPIGVQAPSFVYYPPGFRNILNYIKEKYKNPLTYITENGVADFGNLTLADALADNGRIQCHCSHLSCLKCAIGDGCNVAGYFAWSSMDNYEFGNGFTLRFGMNWVNFTNPVDRRQKDSGKWYSTFIAN